MARFLQTGPDFWTDMDEVLQVTRQQSGNTGKYVIAYILKGGNEFHSIGYADKKRRDEIFLSIISGEPLHEFEYEFEYEFDDEKR